MPSPDLRALRGWLLGLEKKLKNGEGEEAYQSTLTKLKNAGIDSKMLSSWETGAREIPVHHYVSLAHAFGIDPLEPFIERGLLPVNYSSRAQVETLIRLSNAQAELAAMQAGDADERHRTALSKLMDEVVERPNWAVRVEAVVAEFDPEIHLSTRLVFTRANEEKTEHKDVLAISDFSRLLLALNASKSDAKLAGAPGAFSAPVYTRPRAPSAQSIHNCRSIVVLSTTVRSWAPVFAAKIARQLGYGLTSSRDLAAGAANVSIDLCTSAQIGVQAWNLIRSAPDRFVSYHYEVAGMDESQTLEALRALPAHVRVIWLEEDTELLRHAAHHRVRATVPDDLDRLEKYTADMGTALRNNPQVITMPVSLPSGAAFDDDPHVLRPRRISAALHAANEAIALMIQQGWISGNDTPKHRAHT